jgi:hypothetical protein
MIKNKSIMIIALSMILLNGCSGGPGSGLKNEQYDIIHKNVKQVLGDEYDAANFNVTEEGYTDQEKTEYKVKFTFDLNKPVLMFDGKKIPAELNFKKGDDGWKCTFNSANVSGFFNLFGK